MGFNTAIENDRCGWSCHSYTLTYVEKDWQNWVYEVDGVMKVRFRSVSRKYPHNLERMKEQRREEIAEDVRRLKNKARILNVKINWE